MKLVHDIKQQIDASQGALWSKEVSFDKGDYITKQGQIECCLYYVLTGTVRIAFEDENHEYTVRFGYPNTFISCFDSFVHQLPSQFNIIALKKTKLQVIDRASFMQFINATEDIKELWTRALSEIIYQQVQREIDLLTISPMERFQRLLERSPAVFQEIPHKYIASYLRMTPETLSRLL